MLYSFQCLADKVGIGHIREGDAEEGGALHLAAYGMDGTFVACP